MGKYAIINNDFVENVIVLAPENVEAMAEALGKEIIDAAELRLQIGDFRNNGVWTRNEEGEQVVLTERPNYSELVEQLNNSLSFDEIRQTYSEGVNSIDE